MSSIDSAAPEGGLVAPFSFLAAAVASVALATLVAYLAYPGDPFVPAPPGKEPVPFWAVALINGAVAVAVFGWVVPRAIRTIAAGGRSRAGVVLASLAVIGLGLFGLGFAVIFGIAAIGVGLAQRRVGQGGLLPVALGALACVLDLALAVSYYTNTLLPWPPR